MGETLGTQVNSGRRTDHRSLNRRKRYGLRNESHGNRGAVIYHPDAVVNELAAMLEAQGWQEDPMLASGGPTGFGEGSRKADQICMAVAQWLPDASSQLPAGPTCLGVRGDSPPNRCTR